MADDFLDDLGDEMRAAYNPPPETPRAELWRAVRARRALRAAYHPPPETPRAELWAAVRARRGGVSPAATEPRAAPLPGRRPAPVPGRPAPVPVRRWLGWALPIAATLLVGLAIGRFVPLALPDAPVPSGASTEPAPAADGSDAPRAEVSATDVGSAAERGVQAADAVGASVAPRAPTAVERFAAAPERQAPASVADRDREAASSRGAESPRAAAGGLYRVAALETLGGAEALLGAVGGRGGDALPADAAAIADWSEDMLSETRLLMDSPAGEDPAMRALLEDLELVLAQLVRLGQGTTAAGDLALIEGAVGERQLLYRIRALLPAGPITNGT